KRIKYYSGAAIYKKSFHLERQLPAGATLLLELGRVKDICRVWLNGKDLGIVWTAPWQVDITQSLQTGNNRLQVEVINLWPNRLIGDAQLPPEQRITHTNISFKKDAPLLASGLLGPVRIVTL